jgi:membrane protein DedA with SNARE-associated domain
MSGGITEAIKVWAEHFIATTGYPGIGLLALLGNANIPIPSEAVLPVGGILAQQGKMDFHIVAWVGTLGSVLGSVISYGFGAFLGTDFLRKYGKYVLMKTHEIDTAERWFGKYGLQITLWGRFVPLVRSFVSLPAGLYRANFPLFLLYSFLGSLPWCYLWTWLGFKLGENWSAVERYTKIIDIVVILAIVALLAKFLISRFRKKPGTSAAA